MSEAKLGDFVREKITGYEGILYSITHFQHSAPRCMVESRKLHEEKPVGREHFDLCMLEVITPNAVPAVPPETPDCKFKFGDKVRDTASGFEGVVTGWGIFITGCKSVRVQPQKTDRDGRPLSDDNFNEGALELVVATPKETPARKTGGPDRNIAPNRNVEMRY